MRGSECRELLRVGTGESSVLITTDTNSSFATYQKTPRKCISHISTSRKVPNIAKEVFLIPETNIDVLPGNYYINDLVASTVKFVAA